MIVSTDENGRYLGHIDSGYPANPDVLKRVEEAETGRVFDIPPFMPDFWYFPEGVPTVRPRLDYRAEEVMVDGEKATRLTGIPSGTMVEIRGPEEGSIEADDEPLDLVLRTAGEYRVSFEAFPFQAATILITVSAGGANGAA
ncbi:hypothetical protein [Microvirga lenta]|uniref:hypothetical protein n=1 Tax=Microvirga lenta TaxID=2881337 RepID=UPI001CFE035A|nr:hypothetical protein [Microvirga lenta]MCB5173635.1 hypothetical protein [Microvirga lenta]